MSEPKIKSFSHITPMIYAYNLPEVPSHDGWTKIGYTAAKTPKERVYEQTRTDDMHPVIAWTDNAIYKDGSGEYFTDREFHRFLEQRKHIERRPGREWFKISGKKSKEHFDEFAMRSYEDEESENLTYTLRDEQKEAVDKTKVYFENGGTEFLWNAKPRFGKTLTAYDLALQMDLDKILIITNRPSISNSWLEDFKKFVSWRKKYYFVSDSEVMNGKDHVLTRDEFRHEIMNSDEDYGMIAFESLQGLKGSVYFGGDIPKLKWINDLDFDLLIIDESHEGVDTEKTDIVLDNITRDYTLYLSGTPFKALANEQFSQDQIYNWSYADEQEIKAEWSEKEDFNPYERLPKLNMYTYQLSPMIEEEVRKGSAVEDGEETVDYTFDLSEFFKVKDSGRFIYEKEILKFLDTLTEGKKYPFSTPELRDELKHTLWLLNHVDSAKELARLLKEHPVFSEYKIVLAAGDGRLGDDEDRQVKNAYDKVKDAIKQYDKTITLSVGQLTTGITVPEWSGVLMLSNIQSPALYMQAAFRAQNPYEYSDENNKRYRKENAYVFDFDPTRTLTIFNQFANDLNLASLQNKDAKGEAENIRRLLNFFPVLGEDENGEMVELDATQIMSIPTQLKSTEVVRHGFMSNFLFANIDNIFSAPNVVYEIMEQLPTAKEIKPVQTKDKALETIDEVHADEKGNIEIPEEIVIGRANEIFGEKIYDTLAEEIVPNVPEFEADKDNTSESVTKDVEEFSKKVFQSFDEQILEPAFQNYKGHKRIKKQIKKSIENEIKSNFSKRAEDLKNLEKKAKAELAYNRRNGESAEEIAKAELAFKETIENGMTALADSIKKETQKTIEEKPKEIIEKLEEAEAQKKKRTIEDDIRAHLRGFSRTIPSFLMAYGDRGITLRNFETYTDDNVFEEVTGITEDKFVFLRDGGPYTDPETGEEKEFDGELFDEVVFDQSIQKFLDKKEELSDYFNEENNEDIFDYIPPQKTNQIFTPKRVVKLMVDQLEENNPGCFDNPDNTFADLYMKSGLYITEIVKRLYNSEKMKEIYPDDKKRLEHIFTKQVYGMAPSEIIYKIAVNYILGFDEDLKESSLNFVQADAAEAAKNNTLEELVNEYFK